MSYQVIARKYRPASFDDVVGQGAIARTLKNAIASGRVAHAYMFCGPRGVGKTSMARILARALNCLSSAAPTTEPCGTCDLCVRAAVGEDLDVMEIDAASNRKVDDARTLIQNVSFHPTRARFKVYIVDEVHMLTPEAFNALLKTLEEPPPHVKFVFATTDPQKVPATILSRCQRFEFRPVPAQEIAAALRRICEGEGLDAEEAALVAVARASSGGLRDAQSLLEQLATMGAGKVRLDDLHALLGTVPSERMRRLFDALASGDARSALARAAEILDGGTDPTELLRQCMRHAHDLMLVKAQGGRGADLAAEADADTRAALDAQAKAFSEATLVYAVSLLSEALKNARLLGDGRLFAEAAFARLAGHREMRFLDQMVRELQALERRLATGAASGPAGTSFPEESTAPVTVEAPTVATPAAEPAAQTPAAENDLTLDGLRRRWGEVLETARGGSQMRAALAAGAVTGATDDTIVFALPPAASYHRQTLSTPERREALEAAIATVFGRRLRLELVEAAAEPTADQPAAGRPADVPTERLSAAERAAAENAPLTRLVERELKARMVHVERRVERDEPAAPREGRTVESRGES